MARDLDQKRIRNTVEKVLQSYDKETYISPHEQCPMPDRDTIIELAKQLRELLFPGYFRRHACRSEIVNIIRDN